MRLSIRRIAFPALLAIAEPPENLIVSRRSLMQVWTRLPLVGIATSYREQTQPRQEEATSVDERAAMVQAIKLG